MQSFKFKILKSKRPNSIEFKKGSYSGNVDIKDKSMNINLGPNGFLVCCYIFFCIFFFMFGISIVLTWLVLYHSPKNKIKKIAETTKSYLVYYQSDVWIEKI